jgi:hypothetical protein
VAIFFWATLLQALGEVFLKRLKSFNFLSAGGKPPHS